MGFFFIFLFNSISTSLLLICALTFNSINNKAKRNESNLMIHMCNTNTNTPHSIHVHFKRIFCPKQRVYVCCVWFFFSTSLLFFCSCSLDICRQLFMHIMKSVFVAILSCQDYARRRCSRLVQYRRNTRIQKKKKESQIEKKLVNIFVW